MGSTVTSLVYSIFLKWQNCMAEYNRRTAERSGWSTRKVTGYCWEMLASEMWSLAHPPTYGSVSRYLDSSARQVGKYKIIIFQLRPAKLYNSTGVFQPLGRVCFLG